MRLIDVDELRKEIDKQAYPHRDSTANDIYFSVLQLLVDAPTVDAVPVVRCKDCRYWERFGYPRDTGRCHELVDYYDRLYTNENNFCSHGDREDGE